MFTLHLDTQLEEFSFTVVTTMCDLLNVLIDYMKQLIIIYGNFSETWLKQ